MSVIDGRRGTKPVCVEGYSELQLRDAFSMIENKDDWRGPISAVISPWFLSLACAASRHFTSTPLAAVCMNDGNLLVTSPGYRAGPSGP